MLSRVAFFISVLLMCYASFFFYPRWQKGGSEATIAWDVSGYYWYLPGIFIYHDIRHQEYRQAIFDKYDPTAGSFQQAMKLDNGNYVVKYSSGMAVMYLPFFAVAHVLARPLGYPPDGFSPPYQLAIQLGGFLISILGLWYLRKLLLLFYDDKVVAATMILLVFGTNYLNSAAIDCGMSHCWLFTVYVFILLNTHYFYRSFQTKYAVRLGLLIGLAALTRPTDALAALIPLLWGIDRISLQAIRERIALFVAQYKKLLLAAVCAFCVGSIQLIYWKYVSGHWLVYSYGEQGFYWTRPYSMLYAFNYRTGWLIYSPMLMLAIVGIIPFIRNGRNRVAILAFIVLNFYVVSAWDIWWYGGRAMVQSYPALMFPMAALIDTAFRKKVWLYILAPVVCLFLYHNAWVMVQFHGGGLYDSESMPEEYFWRVVGRWHVPERTISLRDNTEVFEQEPKNSRLIYQYAFEHDTDRHVNHDTATGRWSYFLNSQFQRSRAYGFAYPGGKAQWLRLGATYHSHNKEWVSWDMAQVSARLIDGTKQGAASLVKGHMLRPERLLTEGTSREVYIDMKIPGQHFDSVSIDFRNVRGRSILTIDSIKVWQFDE